MGKGPGDFPVAARSPRLNCSMLLSRLRLSPRRRRPGLRAFLTALVCWINLALNLGTGLAGDILRGAGNGPQSRGAAAAEGNAPAAAVQSGVSGTDTLSRTTMALQAVTNMQAAARAAAHGANNAGADPNHPGQTLPNVPNGLVVGGLPGRAWCAGKPGQSGPGRKPGFVAGSEFADPNDVEWSNPRHDHANRAASHPELADLQYRECHATDLRSDGGRRERQPMDRLQQSERSLRLPSQISDR